MAFSSSAMLLSVLLFLNYVEIVVSTECGTGPATLNISTPNGLFLVDWMFGCLSVFVCFVCVCYGCNWFVVWCFFIFHACFISYAVLIIGDSISMGFGVSVNDSGYVCSISPEI